MADLVSLCGAVSLMFFDTLGSRLRACVCVYVCVRGKDQAGGRRVVVRFRVSWILSPVVADLVSFCALCVTQ